MPDRHLGIGTEGTYGTAVAPTTWFEVRREGLAEQPNFEEIPSIRSPSTRQMIFLNNHSAGDFEMTFDFQSVGALFRQFFSVAPTTTAGVHTWPPTAGLGSRLGTSATIEVRRGTDAALNWRYAGAKIVGLTFTGSADGSAAVTASIVAKARSNVAAATPTYLDFDICEPSQMNVRMDALITEPRSFTLNLAWPVDLPFGLSVSDFVLEPDEDGMLSVTGECEIFFDDRTEYDKFAGQTEVDMQITMDDGTHDCTFNMNKCKITSFGTPLEARNRLMGTFGWTSYFDAVATENLQVVLDNDVASYA